MIKKEFNTLKQINTNFCLVVVEYLAPKAA
jgi:hypothetical protein